MDTREKGRTNPSSPRSTRRAQQKVIERPDIQARGSRVDEGGLIEPHFRMAERFLTQEDCGGSSRSRSDQSGHSVGKDEAGFGNQSARHQSAGRRSRNSRASQQSTGSMARMRIRRAFDLKSADGTDTDGGKGRPTRRARRDHSRVSQLSQESLKKVHTFALSQDK